MMNLFDESDRQNLVNFLTDDPALLLIEVTQTLLHQLGPNLDLQGVLGDFPRYAMHISETPHKHVGIRAEKVDEHWLLFGAKVGVDRQRLIVGAVGVKGDLLCVLYWLEVPRMAFRLGGLDDEALEH